MPRRDARYPTYSRASNTRVTITPIESPTTTPSRIIRPSNGEPSRAFESLAPIPRDAGGGATCLGAGGNRFEAIPIVAGGASATGPAGAAIEAVAAVLGSSTKNVTPAAVEAVGGAVASRASEEIVSAGRSSVAVCVVASDCADAGLDVRAGIDVGSARQGSKSVPHD